MKTIRKPENPVNVIVSKDRQRGFYIAIFDSRQVEPRVTIGSTWAAHDKRYGRRYLMRVIETGYNDDYDLKQILGLVRGGPEQPFDDRSLEYYCSEKAWLRLEGEFTNDGLRNVYDQPTVLQTFLSPTTESDNLAVAAPDAERGFVVGKLRSGSAVLEPVVTLDDLFVGHRSLITGASGFGKSTLVRNIARYWLEDFKYGKIIDDLKGEYVADIRNEAGQTVCGLCHHPQARRNLYLLTSRPRSFEGMDLESKIAGIIQLNFQIDDIPPDSLRDLGTELTGPQKAFLDMYREKDGLFRLLLRNEEDGSPYTQDWHEHFKGWIVATKSGRTNIKAEDYTTDLSDFEKSSYTPIFSVRKHLKVLESRPFITIQGESCLSELRRLLKQGATIILDKSGLTDGDKSIISTVIANELYKHNDRYSSGNQEEQKKVIPFVYLVEEAHILLSQEKAKEGAVFVNFAKTGRSFQIGLAAVTQRPSSVDTNILSQFDNFVTFRLTNEQDVRDLIKAKSEFQGYEGDIRTMDRGAAVTAFGEPTKVQSIMVFDWTEQRAKSSLREEQTQLLASLKIPPSRQ
jgi:DNA helicase HerA-like ATPase